MAVHSWSLIELDDDGSTIRSRSLSTSGVLIRQHVPNANADQNGIVTESIAVLFEASGGDTAQEISEEVNTYLEKAATQRQARKRPRVYLLFSTLEESTTWRSPVTGGLIEWDVDALRGFASGYIAGTIILNRENFFERHDDEVTLDSGTAVTNDGTTTVTLDDPGGTMPAPVRVELTNTSGSISTRRFYMAINTDCDPATIDLTLPGRSSSSWTAADAHSVERWTTTFDSGNATKLDELRGERFYILVGMSSVTNGGFYLRVNLNTLVGASKVARAWTPEVYIPNEEKIYAFGPIAIPPTGTGANYGEWSMSLTARNDAGSYNFVAEWVQLMPASSFRKLTQTGYSLATNDKVVDDGITGHTYKYDAGNAFNDAIFEADGSPLVVQPGRASAFKVVWDEESVGVDDTNTMTAAVYCRPRRRTL